MIDTDPTPPHGIARPVLRVRRFTRTRLVWHLIRHGLGVAG